MAQPSIYDYLKPQKTVGILQMPNSYKNVNTAYRPASQASMYSTFRSKKSKAMTEDEVFDSKYITKEKLLTVKPSAQRKIFRCSNGGSIQDQFAKDNKILHYDNFQKQNNNFFSKNGKSEGSPNGQSSKYQKNNFLSSSDGGSSSKTQKFFVKRPCTQDIWASKSQQVKPNDRYNTKSSQETSSMDYSSASAYNRKYKTEQDQQDMVRPQKNYEQDEIRESPIQQRKKRKNKWLSQDVDVRKNNDNYDQEEEEVEEDARSEFMKYREKCFQQEEIDPQWIENLTVDDLADVFPEDILMNKNISFQQLLEEQPDYFQHLFGQCACVKCKCGLCKCDANQPKLKMLKSFQTTYGRDFWNRDSQESAHTRASDTYVTGKFHSTKFGGQEQLDVGYQSLYKADFVKKPLVKNKKKKREWVNYYRPQMNVTSYSNDYQDWKDYDVEHFKKLKHISTDSRIQFNPNTTYSNSFGSVPSLKGLIAPNNLNKRRRPPFPQLTPFEQNSTFMNDYKPFKIKPNGHGKAKNKYTPVPTYEGQFRTTGMRDFGKNSESQCPMRQYKKLFRSQNQNKLEEQRNQKTSQEIMRLTREIEDAERSDVGYDGIY